MRYIDKRMNELFDLWLEKITDQEVKEWISKNRDIYFAWTVFFLSGTIKDLKKDE